jgi:hypothetical protein
MEAEEIDGEESGIARGGEDAAAAAPEEICG